MRSMLWAAGSLCGALCVGAPEAWAGDVRPRAREIQETVDGYLRDVAPDASLVGGTGGAGYDQGFWIRGGDFSLRVNLTVQARYEAFDWDDTAVEPRPGGDLSGFSLPRTTLKLSGGAPCRTRYYAELEFGHAAAVEPPMPMAPGPMPMHMPGNVMFMHDPGILREAWIEHETCEALSIRAGLVQTANTRQMMTPPEKQQFVDVSMAAASVGMMMPGYTDRNRDYGIMFHGELGCGGALSYLVTVTNGDGSVARNVLDQSTNDNLAYSARVNWDILGSLGYDECAVNRRCGQWDLAVGAWAWVYDDVWADGPHLHAGDRLDVGADVAGGYGGFSFCAAITYAQTRNVDAPFIEDTSWCWCVQAGYLFPGTALEVAARFSTIDMEMGVGPGMMEEAAHELGFAVNYFLNGHANKLTADISFISPDKDGNSFADIYAGYQATMLSDAVLLRFQWQLAL